MRRIRHASPPQVIVLPVGQITPWLGPASTAKIYRFAAPPNQLYNSAVPFRTRGVGHRHERWNGMRWTRQRRARRMIAGRFAVSDHRAPDERRLSPAKPSGEDGWLRTAKPCGSGTRCWCQVGGGDVGPTGRDKTFNPPMTVTRGIRRRGERGISRKAIARGMPECFR
jgi:hypothetical protein